MPSGALGALGTHICTRCTTCCTTCCTSCCTSRVRSRPSTVAARVCTLPGRTTRPSPDQNLRPLYRLRRICRESQGVDFDDLLSLTVALLQQAPAARAELQRRWQHVLVDEFQVAWEKRLAMKLRWKLGRPGARTCRNCCNQLKANQLCCGVWNR